jgi:hypothetical protein
VTLRGTVGDGQDRTGRSGKGRAATIRADVRGPGAGPTGPSYGDGETPLAGAPKRARAPDVGEVAEVAPDAASTATDHEVILPATGTGSGPSAGVAALGALGAASWLERERRRGAGETDEVW